MSEVTRGRFSVLAYSIQCDDPVPPVWSKRAGFPLCGWIVLPSVCAGPTLPWAEGQWRRAAVGACGVCVERGPSTCGFIHSGHLPRSAGHEEVLFFLPFLPAPPS